jgi:NAD(P)-dependent dehydrogenase (short-subunit alcohol dehydrogenase family)
MEELIMSKIVVIGASGTIGQAVADLLEKNHEVVRVRNSEGSQTVDLSSKDSIEEMFKRIGSFDALVSAAGVSNFGNLDEARDEDYMTGLNNKLMGQVNLVRIGLNYIKDNGSFTLTSGLLGREPWPGTVPTAMVNAGLDGFVRAAALDMSKGIRVNIVSPIFVTETAEKMGMDTSGSMSAADTALAYKASVEGDVNGQVLDVRDYE